MVHKEASVSTETKVRLTQAERWHCGLLLSGVKNAEIHRSEEARDLLSGDAVDFNDLDGGGFVAHFADGSRIEATAGRTVVL